MQPTNEERDGILREKLHQLKAKLTGMRPEGWGSGGSRVPPETVLLERAKVRAAQSSAAPAAKKERASVAHLARALKANELADSDEVVSSGDELGGIGKPSLSARRAAFRRMAKIHPGKLAIKGLDQFGQHLHAQLGDPEAGALDPICLRYLMSVYLPTHPIRQIGEENYRNLRTLAEAMDLILRGHHLETLDLLMQRFKASTLAIKDGNWSSARWLELIPIDSDGAALSHDEVELVRAVEAGELKLEDLVARLKSRGKGHASSATVR